LEDKKLTDEEIDKKLNRYSIFFEWVNSIIAGNANPAITSERTSGNTINWLINEICELNVQRPLTVISLKPWIDE